MRGLRIEISSDDYPARLRSLKNPPSSLYYYCADKNKSLLDFLSSPISIVGTRKASLYGKRMVRGLVDSLEVYKPTIVSGLAAGIDSEAHLAAISAKLPTIAVLGMGIERMSRSNYVFKALLENENACIVSEYEPRMPATKWTFAERNRVIAALSDATIVAEAPSKSGALITAKHALQLDRKLYTIPGELDDPNFAGSNDLLRSNQAQAIYSPELLVRELGLQAVPEDLQSFVNYGFEKESFSSKESSCKELRAQGQNLSLEDMSLQILEFLRLAQKLSFDNLHLELGLDSQKLGEALSMLEVQGRVRRLSGSIYAAN